MNAHARHAVITRLGARAVAAALIMLLGACARGRPLVAHDPLPRPAPATPALAAGEAAAPALNGTYDATFKLPLLGEITGRFAAETTGNRFRANTRPGVAWEMVGGIEGFFGSMFVNFLFPGGAILTWDSTLPVGGTPGEGILSPGEFRSAQIATRMTSPRAPVEILDKYGRHVATITLRPTQSAAPLADYPALASGVERAMQARLFDASLTTSGQVRGYLRQLAANAARSRDDVEFIFGAIAAGRNHVRFALPLVFKQVEPDWRSQLADLADAGLSAIKVTHEQGIATLKADIFLDAADVDRAFTQVLARRPRALILDLRGCPGVTLASLRVASWLIDEPVDAGVFFGPGRRKAVLAGRIDDVPGFDLSSAESVESIERHLDEAAGSGAARITIYPNPPGQRFTGPVAVLTSRKTTTSAEALAWTLKAAGPRIRLFGQPTAGRPTLSRPIDIGMGWAAWLPAFDYRPPELLATERTDRGVRPHYDNRSKTKAKEAALTWLNESAT